MGKIERHPKDAAQHSYGLIIVGGGIYGTMIALSAARRGLSALVLEQNDFASATSFNSLKTIHGGLRYLQDLSFKLYFHYVRERRWFLRTLAHQVQPLPVLMPLYNRGLKRRSLLRVAFQLDKFLSPKRNQDMEPGQAVPFGRMIGRKQTIDLFPAVDQKGLKGGACWHDAFMPDPQLLLLSLLKQACDLGVTALNYCKVTKLTRDDNRVNGVIATDRTDSAEYRFSAPIVVNAAGPWVRELSGILDAEFADLFKYSVAWNVLFKRDAFSDHALALTPRKFGAQTYFAHSWNNKLLIGTGHAPRHEFSEDPLPTEEELEIFISDINSAVPSANFSIGDIDHIYAGFLPVSKDGRTNLLRRGQIFDHARYGGPTGLYSITGVKYSAAHGMAEDLIDRLFPGLKKLSVTELVFSDSKDHRFRGETFKQDPVAEIRKHAEYLRSLIHNEAVIHLDDLVLRRTNIGDDPATAIRVAPHVADIFGWDAQRKSAEIQRLLKHYRFHASA